MFIGIDGINGYFKVFLSITRSQIEPKKNKTKKTITDTNSEINISSRHMKLN
jgi:hypothetical protein